MLSSGEGSQSTLTLTRAVQSIQGKKNSRSCRSAVVTARIQERGLDVTADQTGSRALKGQSKQTKHHFVQRHGRSAKNKEKHTATYPRKTRELSTLGTLVAAQQ